MYSVFPLRLLAYPLFFPLRATHLLLISVNYVQGFPFFTLLCQKCCNVAILLMITTQTALQMKLHEKTSNQFETLELLPYQGALPKLIKFFFKHFPH